MGRPKLKLPPVPSPIALPTVDKSVGEEEMKDVRRRSGYERTLVTGALTPKKKKTIIGGSYA